MGFKQFSSSQQYFTVQRQCEDLLKQVCPDLKHSSGIYFYIRIEENEKSAYIGKSVDCLKRCISHHLGRKQPIDNSIHKRGYYDKDNNSLGWKLNVLYFKESELDEKEQYYIDLYKNAGYELYNIESGGTIGKTIIGERQSPKNYRDGVDYGYLKARREISHLFKLHLDYSIKGEKTSVNKEKALEKFKNFITIDENE